MSIYAQFACKRDSMKSIVPRILSFAAGGICGICAILSVAALFGPWGLVKSSMGMMGAGMMGMGSMGLGTGGTSGNKAVAGFGPTRAFNYLSKTSVWLDSGDAMEKFYALMSMAPAIRPVVMNPPDWLHAVCAFGAIASLLGALALAAALMNICTRAYSVSCLVSGLALTMAACDAVAIVIFAARVANIYNEYYGIQMQSNGLGLSGMPSYEAMMQNSFMSNSLMGQASGNSNSAKIKCEGWGIVLTIISLIGGVVAGILGCVGCCFGKRQSSSY